MGEKALNDHDLIMTLTAILGRTKPLHIVVVGLLFLAFTVLVNFLPVPVMTLEIFNSILQLLLSLFVSFFLLALSRSSNHSHYKFTRPLFWMGLSMVAWSLGDALWLYMISNDISTFISPVDILYISAYVLNIVSFLTIPGSNLPSRRRNMVFIEISILVLSASVIFTILLLGPGKFNLSLPPLTLVVLFLYPVLDTILIWILMILFFSYPVISSQKVVGILFAGAVGIFCSDLIYLSSTLYDFEIVTYLVDLGYYFFYFMVFFGGIIGFREIREKVAGDEMHKKYSKAADWIVFLPGIILIVLIGLLLVFVLNQSPIYFHGIVVLMALIIVLFVMHQYLVIDDNIKLNKEMRISNIKLESQVERRTVELSRANIDLQDEIKVREKVEEDLARSNQELVLSNLDKDKFFSILAHDLRNPLGSMMSLSGLMVEGIRDFDEKEIIENIDAIHKSATQTFQLLNDLLAWSAVQMGRGENEKEVFSIAESVSENIVSLSSVAENKQIEMRSDIDPTIGAFADKFAIQTVLRNLISNAIKFTQREGRVSIKAEIKQPFIEISVTDNGSGISEEKQKQIFRVDAVNSSPGTDGEQGTGLGLLLSKDLVERNGGEIGLFSDLGKGSSFYFTLPYYGKVDIVIATPAVVPSTRIEYRFDLSTKIGFTSLIGEFNPDLLKMELPRIWASRDYKPDVPSLVDLRLASFDLEIKDLSGLLGIFESLNGTLINRKFAVLTSTPRHVVLTTMLNQNIRLKYPVSVEAFSTMDGAMNWLIG